MALRAIKLKRKIKFPSPLLHNQPYKRNSMIPFLQKFNLFVTQCMRQENYLQAKFKQVEAVSADLNHQF